MTHPNRPDPLDRAERTLADALAHATPVSGPSPALDAAILAAAREAATKRTGAGAPVAAPPPSTSTRAGSHRRRRSPAWLRGGALAATLVLAIGVAWQMRPQLEVVHLAEEAPVATQAQVPSPRTAAEPPPAAMAAPSQPAPPPPSPRPAERAPAASQAADMAGPPAGAVAPAPPAGRSDAPRVEPTAAREAVAAPDQALSERAAPSERAVKSARPAPSAAPASVGAFEPEAVRSPLPPAPPASAPAPPPPSPAASRMLQALPPPRPASTSEAAARARVADSQDDARAIDGEAMHDEDWLDQPLDDTPPASADAPAVREAWLARIRELVASERYGEARASFAEFRRRHPGEAVPDDLRTLLGEE